MRAASLVLLLSPALVGLPTGAAAQEADMPASHSAASPVAAPLPKASDQIAPTEEDQSAAPGSTGPAPSAPAAAPPQAEPKDSAEGDDSAAEPDAGAEADPGAADDGDPGDAAGDNPDATPATPRAGVSAKAAAPEGVAGDAGAPPAGETMPQLPAGEAPAGEAPVGEDAPAGKDGNAGEDATATPPETGSPIAPAAGGAGAINPNPLATLKLDALEATRSAPLFTPSRTAPEVAVEAAPPPPAEPEPPPPPEPPQLQLIGVVMSNAQQVALLSDPGGGEVHRLKPGEDYEGWTLKIIDPRTVELKNGDQTQKLTMFSEFKAPGQAGEEGATPRRTVARSEANPAGSLDSGDPLGERPPMGRRLKGRHLPRPSP